MSDERFDLLLEKYLDRALTPSESEEFQAFLKRDEGLRAQYVSALTQVSMLRRIHRAKTTESARADVRNIRLARGSMRIKKSRKAERGNFSLALKACGAVAALIALVFAFQYSRRGPAPETAISDAGSQPKATPAEPEKKAVEVQDVIVEANTEKTLTAEDLAGRKVITREKAVAYIQYKDGTAIELKENTQVRWGRADAQKGKEVEALAGSMSIHAVPQPPDRPLQIVSAHGRVTVLGTTFWLSVDGQGTRVDLLKGKVGLTRASDNTTLQLTEGQRAVLAPGAVLEAAPLKLEKGKLLYSEEFDPQLKNWDKAGMSFQIAKIENENPQLPTLKLLPAKDQVCSATLSFGRALARMPGSFSIEYRMRSLPFYRNVNSFHVGIDSNGAAETNVEENLTDNKKYTFFRFRWVQCRLEISQNTDADGNPTAHYRSYFGNVFKNSRVAKGPALGMMFVQNNLPMEIADLKIYDLVPAK